MQTLTTEPGLHDWTYEQETVKADARDETFDLFKSSFKSELIRDFQYENFEKIKEVMGAVVEVIFDEPTRTPDFLRGLFAAAFDVFADSRLRGALNDALNCVIEKEFDRRTRQNEQ